MISFHVIDQYAHPVIRLGKREVPIESNVGLKMVDVRVVMDDWSSDKRESGATRRIATKRARRFEDAGKTPARGSIDEQAYQNALVEK